MPSKFSCGHFHFTLAALKTKPIQWTPSQRKIFPGNQPAIISKYKAQVSALVQGSGFASRVMRIEVVVSAFKLGASPSLLWNNDLWKEQWIWAAVNEVYLVNSANQHDTHMSQMFRQTLVC